MPFVRSHTRRGRRVRGHYRLRSRVAFVVGLILLLLWFAILRKQGGY